MHVSSIGANSWNKSYDQPEMISGPAKFAKDGISINVIALYGLARIGLYLA